MVFEYSRPLSRKTVLKREETTGVLDWTSEFQTCFHRSGLYPKRSSSLVRDLVSSLHSFLYLYWLNHQLIDINKNNIWFSKCPRNKTFIFIISVYRIFSHSEAFSCFVQPNPAHYLLIKTMFLIIFTTELWATFLLISYFLITSWAPSNKSPRPTTWPIIYLRAFLTQRQPMIEHSEGWSSRNTPSDDFF